MGEKVFVFQFCIFNGQFPKYPPYNQKEEPAIVDTGFDGGIYPNIKVIKILEGLKPLKVKRIESPLYEPIECEIYNVEAALLDRGSGRQIPLGTVNLYVPTEPEYLSNEVLIGREILNKLELRLNGRWTEIKTR